MQPSVTTGSSIDSHTQPSLISFSIYIDDLVPGSRDTEPTYELYKLQLATAGFKLRKVGTNSEELSQRIQANESLDGNHMPRAPWVTSEPGTNKILGV